MTKYELDVEPSFSEIVAQMNRHMLDTISRQMWMDEMCGGLFYNRGESLRGASLGRAPDWTTALCEGRTERDDGIAQARAIHHQQKIDVVLELAAEWGIEPSELARWEC